MRQLIEDKIMVKVMAEALNVDEDVEEEDVEEMMSTLAKIVLMKEKPRGTNQRFIVTSVRSLVILLMNVITIKITKWKKILTMLNEKKKICCC